MSPEWSQPFAALHGEGEEGFGLFLKDLAVKCGDHQRHLQHRQIELPELAVAHNELKRDEGSNRIFKNFGELHCISLSYQRTISYNYISAYLAMKRPVRMYMIQWILEALPDKRLMKV